MGQFRCNTKLWLLLHKQETKDLAGADYNKGQIFFFTSKVPYFCILVLSCLC